MVQLRDGRKIIGIMRSFDQFANIVLEQAVERIGKIQQDAVLSMKVTKETFVFVERSPALRQQCQRPRWWQEGRPR